MLSGYYLSCYEDYFPCPCNLGKEIVLKVMSFSNINRQYVRVYEFGLSSILIVEVKLSFPTPVEVVPRSVAVSTDLWLGHVM